MGKAYFKFKVLYLSTFFFFLPCSQLFGVGQYVYRSSPLLVISTFASFLTLITSFEQTIYFSDFLCLSGIPLSFKAYHHRLVLWQYIRMYAFSTSIKILIVSVLCCLQVFCPLTKCELELVLDNCRFFSECRSITFSHTFMTRSFSFFYSSIIIAFEHINPCFCRWVSVNSGIMRQGRLLVQQLL